MELVVSPVFHRYEPVWPLEVKVTVPGEQNVVEPLAEIVGTAEVFGLTVIVPFMIDSQPKVLFLALTVYSPAVEKLTLGMETGEPVP